MAKDRLGGKRTLKVGGFLDEFEKDDVKKKIDIVTLFDHFGIRLTKKGKNYVALCPWHPDTNPSLSVTKETGQYHCFSCHEAGDHFTLVEKMKGCGFKEALAYLKGLAGKAAVTPEVKPKETEKKPAPVKKITETVPTEKITAPVPDPGKPVMANVSLDIVGDYYHKKLYANKTGMTYLTEIRKIKTELINRFKIGFADKSLLEIVSNGQKEALKVLGILKTTEKGRVWEFFTGCLTFPIVDEAGKVVHFYGRKADPKADNPHLYLSGSHKSVFNRKASRVYDTIIIVESILDCLSLITLGIENVQPLYGTNGFTAEHLQILKDDNVKTIILALDNDEAGRKAASAHKVKLLDEGFAVKTIFSTLSKDWNGELAAGMDKKTFMLLVEEAKAEKNEEREKRFGIIHEGIKDIFTTEQITYEIVGANGMFITNLRVNVKTSCKGQTYYDNADLTSGRSRKALSETLADFFSIESKLIELDLMYILDHYAKARDKRYAELGSTGEKAELSPEERKAGMKFLTNPGMFDEIVSDIEQLGYVGERMNKILLYLVASSRILDDPISALILSQSAAGKSMLVSTLKKLIPAEDVISVTSLSDQALNYVPSMLHKFLDLGEAVHSQIIEHQIREMLSAKELCRLVTIKDEKTGQLKSELKKTPALVAAVMTTTRQNTNPENASRFFVINTDETKEQTHRIHAFQREKYSLERRRFKTGMLPRIISKHHAAQRLLKKMVIVNNFTHHIGFPDTLMRVRRDHERFIDLIACVCFVRQYQKEVKNSGEFEYIECDIEDYRLAYDIMVNGVLASTLTELPKSAAGLYETIRAFARESADKAGLKSTEIKFTQRKIREYAGCGHTWTKTNIRVLVDYEYLLVARGGKERAKGIYQLRADESIMTLNLSMIPSPDAMEKLIK